MAGHASGSISTEEIVFHLGIAFPAIVTLFLLALDPLVTIGEVTSGPDIVLSPIWFAISGLTFAYALFSLIGAAVWSHGKTKLFLFTSALTNTAVSPFHSAMDWKYHDACPFVF